MHKHTRLNCVVMVLLLLILGISCSKNDLLQIDGIAFSPTIAAPIAQVKFLFADFIKSDSAIQVGADKSIKVVYVQDDFASLAYADIAPQILGNLNAAFAKNLTIGDLTLNTNALSAAKNLSLGEAVSSFSEPFKTFFTNSFGQTTVVPAFIQNANSTVNLDDLTEFTNVNFASGFLDLTIQNGFPFPLSAFNIQILDRNNANSVLATIPVPNLSANATTVVSADLTNKIFSNKLAYRVQTIASTGTGTTAVFLNPNANLAVQFAGRSTKIKSGNIKLPQTNLNTERVNMDIILPRNDQKLTEIEFKTATVNFSITQTRALPCRILMHFPTVKINGLPVTRTVDVTSSPTTGTINFANALISLTNDATQPFNRLPVDISVVLNASNNYLAVNNTDNIAVNASILTPSVKSAKGLFGAFDIDLPVKTLDFVNLESFNALDKASQKLLFDDPKFYIRTANSFGIPIETNFNVSASGVVSGTENMNPPVFAIPCPRANQVGRTELGMFEVNKSNSNLVNFLGILPKKLTYSGKIKVKSNISGETNFFTEGSKITLGANLELPLKFSTQSLVVRDTTQNNPLSNLREKAHLIESATLVLNPNNGFPLKVVVELMVLKNGVATPTGILATIEAATIGTDGKVTTANTTKKDVVIPKDKLQLILNADKLIIVGKVQTANGGTTAVTLLTNYAFELNLSAAAKLKIE